METITNLTVKCGGFDIILCKELDHYDNGRFCGTSTEEIYISSEQSDAYMWAQELPLMRVVRKDQAKSRWMVVRNLHDAGYAEAIPIPTVEWETSRPLPSARIIITQHQRCVTVNSSLPRIGRGKVYPSVENFISKLAKDFALWQPEYPIQIAFSGEETTPRLGVKIYRLPLCERSELKRVAKLLERYCSVVIWASEAAPD